MKVHIAASPFQMILRALRMLMLGIYLSIFIVLINREQSGIQDWVCISLNYFWKERRGVWAVSILKMGGLL